MGLLHQRVQWHFLALSKASDVKFRINADLDSGSEQTHTHRHARTHTHLNVVSEEVASVFVLQLLCWQQWQDKVFWHLQGTFLSHTRDTWAHMNTHTHAHTHWTWGALNHWQATVRGQDVRTLLQGSPHWCTSKYCNVMLTSDAEKAPLHFSVQHFLLSFIRLESLGYQITACSTCCCLAKDIE